MKTLIPHLDLLQGDCLEKMKEMSDNSVDSIVTDPPYGIGFMGKKWDIGIPAVEVFEQCLRVLKPGGHLLAFGGSRTYHRLAVAVEDAGFEIRDQIMWVYGSGFPKSQNVGKVIDKKAGKEREVIGYNEEAIKKVKAEIERGQSNINRSFQLKGLTSKQDGFQNPQTIGEITAPSTEEAKKWDGWGTSLKPAHEPIVVARKPLISTVVNNILEYGTGALNIDACRVGYVSESDKRLETRGVHVGGAYQHESGDAFKRTVSPVASVNHKGRWPANFIHDGSDEVVELFPDSNGSRILNRSEKPNQEGWGMNTKAKDIVSLPDAGKGSASRFFYCAKASKKDKGEGNIHPTVKPNTLMRYLCKLITPPGGIVLDPFMGSGSTGKAAIEEGFGFVGIELEKDSFETSKRRIYTCVEEEEKRIMAEEKKAIWNEIWLT